MTKKATIFDIADAVGISTGTVHRALHNYPGISPSTKHRILEAAKTLGYRPNLAARFLARRTNLRISVNTFQGTTSFWDDVRAGVNEEAKSLPIENVELAFRTCPSLTDVDQEAFEAVFTTGCDGVILFPSTLQDMRPYIQRASQLRIPTVCVATDAPDTGRLTVVSTDARGSGSLAADLLGRCLRGSGKVAVTLSDFGIVEHSEKCNAFTASLSSLYPEIQIVSQIEDHDVEAEAYRKCRELFREHPDLDGAYITTEASMPVLRAARDAGILKNLTIITTDLFPQLVPEIRSGTVTATIYQRPRTQGRLAFRALYQHLVEGQTPPEQITLVPHLVMRSNLDFFLQRQSA